MKPRKLSAGRPRADLIASYGYGSTALATPPPPPKAPAAPAPKAPAGVDPDAAVTDAIAALKAALQKALDAQKADPDASDPNDEKVQATLDQIAQQIAQLEKDQATDVAGDTAEAPAAPAKVPAPKAPPVTAAAPAAAAPKTSPVDADGNIDGSAVCANPDCGHLASSHLNDDTNGENTGACQMTNCACLGMQVESQPNTGTGDGGGQNVGAQPSSGSQELAPVNTTPDAPMPPGPGHAETAPNLNEPPQIPGGENMGPAFTIPVMVIEGQPTGDGRQIAPGALSWRVPPLPLMGLATETHDPEGFDQNDPAVLCGRIDSLERQPGEGDTQVIVAKGFYLPNDDGQYFADLTQAMGRCGISADIAVSQEEIEIGEVDQDGWPTDMTAVLTEGQIMGCTQVPFPAFEGAYIVLGDGTVSMPIPAEHEGTPVTAAGIHWMTYEQCERCDQGLEVIVASGAGPVAPPREWFENPNFQVGDGRVAEIFDRRGQRTVAGKYACPLTITDEGRVYGHLAPWGVCHIGKPGCVTAPKSGTDYAFFKRGQHIVCADGSKVRVGTLTVDAGHASLRDSPTAAMAHYDNIALAAADVNAGEDEHGIWIAGAIRPTATQEQIRALRASSISGDWRSLGGSLELVAALAVPVPGFPHAVVAGAHEEALVAAGASAMYRLKHPVVPEAETGDVALRHALAPLLTQARALARERLAVLRR